MVDVPYRSAVGSLMYLAVCTRPDISAAVSTLSRFNTNPSLPQEDGVRHLVQYVRGTGSEGLVYRHGASISLWGFCDASHFTCPDTGRSRAAFVLMSAGAAVSWQSKLQENATLSSCESEYLGFFMAAQEASYMRKL